MSELPVEPATTQAPSARGRWLAGCGGAVLALACVGAYWLFTLGPHLPAVTSTELEAARALWQAKKPADYDLAVQVTVGERTDYLLEVRGGEVVSATHNGVAMPPHAWRTWDVSGMFTTIAQDLETNAGQPGGAPAGNLVLRGEFDATLGYPRKYQRIQLNPASEVSFEIVRFTPVSAP